MQEFFDGPSSCGVCHNEESTLDRGHTPLNHVGVTVFDGGTIEYQTWGAHSPTPMPSTPLPGTISLLAPVLLAGVWAVRKRRARVLSE